MKDTTNIPSFPEEQKETTRTELKHLKEEIIWSIDENLSDRTDSLRNTFNPYRAEYGAGIYKNPRW